MVNWRRRWCGGRLPTEWRAAQLQPSSITSARAGTLTGWGRREGGRDKDMVRYMGCMAHWWCSPVLTGLTVRDEAKGGLGPPHRVICQARWALVRVGEGGGAPHTHPLLLPGQVKMAVQDRRNGVMG